jgi:hypothetical protein
VRSDRQGHEDDLVPFAVWPKDGSDTDARPHRAWSAEDAARQRAREDWDAGQVETTDWPITYCVRDGVTGTIWVIDVALAMQPSFVAIDAREIAMPPAAHVLWGGRVLCEDLRLRGVPRDWPNDQRWISLRDVADGVETPPDRCAACWAKVPGLVEGLRQIGADR